MTAEPQTTIQVTHCGDCPFAAYTRLEGHACVAVRATLGYRNVDSHRAGESAPDWCPLRAGLLVELRRKREAR